MRAFLSLAAAAVLAATGIAFTARAQQQVQYFYCYVPNAATSTVYMTQTLPVGRSPSAAGYGEEYAAYLRGEGLVSASARGDRTMRPTTGEIAVARQDLQSDCAECNGATRFTTAAWARPGLPNAPEPKTAETSIQARRPAAIHADRAPRPGKTAGAAPCRDRQRRHGRSAGCHGTQRGKNRRRHHRAVLSAHGLE